MCFTSSISWGNEREIPSENNSDTGKVSKCVNVFIKNIIKSQKKLKKYNSLAILCLSFNSNMI
jgi:hypothetical protein